MIRYDDPRVLGARAEASLTKRQRRGEWVVGCWCERRGEMVLLALAHDPVTRMVVDEMTTQLVRMATWNSRQAAHLYVRRRSVRYSPIHVPVYESD